DSPLQLAAEHNDVATMALLLDHGAPIDAIFGDGNYPWRDARALQRASGRGHMAMVRLLVARGADLECAGHLGTALGFAVHGRHVDIVRFLLEKGADAAA
ncbi:ankyrin repeat-containing domain protein, partial [Mycena pura]